MTYPFTNHFDRHNLKERIQRLNESDSDRGWWRYALMWLATIGLVMACQNWKSDEKPVERGFLAPANPTRRLVVQLEEDPVWQSVVRFFQNRNESWLHHQNDHELIVALIDDHLLLKEQYKARTRVFINGKEAPPAAVDLVTPFNIKELFVLKKPDAFPGTEDAADPTTYRLLIETGTNYRRADPERQNLFLLLQASMQTNNPFGQSYTFSMNELLEATFFQKKTPFVFRTKDNHLQIYDEFLTDLTVFINGQPASPDAVMQIHVREVDKLYSRERPYKEWMRTDPERPSRFVLVIQTSPNRAQRDSSYYVFSPFYSGDF